MIDFGVGMKHAVREDPDVMLVGEMRDQETFMTAIHAAETGHLVFGTIHASTAPTTIGRILDLFPEEMHGAIRSAIAFNMKAHCRSEAAAVDQAGRGSRTDGRDHDVHADRSASSSWKGRMPSCPMPSGLASRRACRTSR